MIHDAMKSIAERRFEYDKTKRTIVEIMVPALTITADDVSERPEEGSM